MLIANDVNPQLMVKHVVDISVLCDIPLLIVPELRILLKNCTGIVSVIIGIKNTTPPGSQLQLLAQKIKELHCNYPVPKEHVNYHRKYAMLTETKESVAATNDSDMSQTIERVNKETSESVCRAITDTCASETNESSNQLYLFRDSKNKRVFVPVTSDGSARIIDKSEDKMEYLALDQTTEKPEIQTSVSYRSLIVKRLKGNKDRNRRKKDVMREKKRKHKF